MQPKLTFVLGTLESWITANFGSEAYAADTVRSYEIKCNVDDGATSAVTTIAPFDITFLNAPDPCNYQNAIDHPVVPTELEILYGDPLNQSGHSLADAGDTEGNNQADFYLCGPREYELYDFATQSKIDWVERVSNSDQTSTMTVSPSSDLIDTSYTVYWRISLTNYPDVASNSDNFILEIKCPDTAFLDFGQPPVALAFTYDMSVDDDTLTFPMTSVTELSSGACFVMTSKTVTDSGAAVPSSIVDYNLSTSEVTIGYDQNSLGKTVTYVN